MRWLIRSLVALVLLAVLGVLALFLIPTERVAQVAADKFETVTGRTLTISGSVRPTIWPVLGVKTGPISISNASWSKAGPMLEAEGLDIGVDMSALWNGSVRITGIRADNPRILLERAADGRENWVFGGSNGGTAQAGMAGEGTPFTLDLAEMRNGSISFTDHRAGTKIALSALDGTLKVPSFTGPADISFSGQMNGQAVKVSLTIAEFAPFLEGRLTGLDVKLSAGDADIAFVGRGGWNPMGAAGDLTADLGDLAAVSQLAGIARPALPAGLGARSVSVAGSVTLTDQASLHLRGGKVGLDDNRLTVEADLTTAGARPKLSAQVGGGALNLAGLSGGAGGGSGGGVAAPGWPRDPIDASALGNIDAAVALTADAVNLGMAKLGVTRVMATIDKGRAVFDLRQVQAYQGSITGQFVVNSRGGLSVGGDLTLAGLEMQPLLTDVAGYDRLIGTGDVALKFLGSGNSVDAIMQSLSGSGRVGFGKGELLGLDIAGMLRNLDPGYVGKGQKTIFDSIGASFTIDKGVLQNDDLTLKAPYLTAAGSGQVGIGARTLNYRIRPTAFSKADGTGGVMVPLWITGSWAKPTYRLDLEALAKEKLDAQAKALEEQARAKAKEAEAKARAQIQQKVQDQLGVQQQPGESIEDAAKRRAQEALQDEAAKALGRLLGKP